MLRGSDAGGSPVEREILRSKRRARPQRPKRTPQAVLAGGLVRQLDEVQRTTLPMEMFVWPTAGILFRQYRSRAPAASVSDRAREQLSIFPSR